MEECDGSYGGNGLGIHRLEKLPAKEHHCEVGGHGMHVHL